MNNIKSTIMCSGGLEMIKNILILVVTVKYLHSLKLIKKRRSLY